MFEEVTSFERIVIKAAFRSGGIKLIDLVNEYKVSPFYLFLLMEKYPTQLSVNNGYCEVTKEGRRVFLSNRKAMFLQPRENRVC